MSKSAEQINALISKTVRSGKREIELAHKGLTFGRWLNEVGEYEKAASWVTKYLAIHDRDAKAHRLLGDIYEKLNKSDAALSCYKNSLRVKPQQYELMLKVAEMHINPGPTQNPGRAQVWLDKAALALPNNPQVYKLKMELHLAQEALPSKLEDTILEELKKRPADPSLHVQYVSFLKDQERLEDAFSYSEKTVRSGDLPKAVENDLEWNQCLVDTCQDYAERMCDDEVTPEGIGAYSLLLISICKNIWLLFEKEKYDDAMDNLAMLDTTVFSALILSQEAKEGGDQEWSAILNESKGQLYWLCGIGLIHLATRDDVQWGDATKLSAACFAVSLSFPMTDVSETWASWSKDSTFSRNLKVMGGFRLSQSAHMLYNLTSMSHVANEEENTINEREWLREVTDNFCTNEGRRKVFDNLFDQSKNPETSMICTDDNFSQVSAQLVSEESLNDYDAIAALRTDLQTWIWMGLQWRQNFDNALDPFSWISAMFPEVQLSAASSAKYGNLWNLTQLDVESFIVGCVLCAEKSVSLWKNSKPNLQEGALSLSRLPLPLCKRLTTGQQDDWWDSVCKLHYRKGKERIFNANQVKATLRHGIESLRGSGNHGLQLMLISGISKHFAAKACAINKSGMGTSSAVWLAYQKRAADYWNIALPMLQDVTINKSRMKAQPKDCLFPCTLSEPTVQEANSMISEVFMCNGGLLAQEGDLKRALDTYGKADTPHASFCEALIFKQLLDNCGKEEKTITGSNGKKIETYTRKYAARLEVTLNRLQREPDEELLRRTEELLHAHVSESPTMIRRAKESDPKRLFDETIPKLLQHIGNHTFNSEVDVSVLAGPSKQSTPKSETRPHSEAAASERTVMTQLAHTLSSLTSTLSTTQIQMNERISKMEQTRIPKQELNQSSIDNVCSQLEKLTTIVSGLQEKKDNDAEEKQRMKLQIEMLHEQLLHPGRMVQLSQTERLPPGSPLQVFDHYQQASLGQISSPMQPGGPYVTMPAAYQGGYLPQNPAMAPMFAHQGYNLPQGMPPVYGQGRMPSQVMDQRIAAIPSPIGTPPIPIRPQQTSSNPGLPMSKEAADALSVRFQSFMGGSSSPVTGPPSGMQHLAPSTMQPNLLGMSSFDQQMMPGTIQGRGQPAIGNDQGLFLNSLSLGPEPLPTMVPRPSVPQSLDESYLPPNVTNTVTQGTSLLKSLLSSGQPATYEQQATQSELHYPKHINFPERKDQPPSGGTGWNFKFQAPEDIDKDNKKLEADEEAEDAETSHNDTGPHFEPLVTLPEVEVRTGEEEEDAVFSERAKLYRWHEGQWKERGAGTMKVLKHKVTGKYRLLMRRDQILKICCNHVIGKSLNLQPMPNTDKAWIWHATDFSEEGGKQEGLAIRFKTPEIANEFKAKFAEGQQANAAIGGGTPVKQLPEPASQESSSTSTIAPPTVPPTGVTQAFTTAVQQVTVGGTVMPKFNFALAKQSAGSLDLSAKIAGTPAGTQEQGKEADEPDGGEGEGVDTETGDGPHFEPIIELPDKVETKTGEEDEEVLFCHRAKLYRYVDKQWKERGVGDIKILHNTGSKKYRIVMRRDQILKLCANHYITPDMTLAPMSIAEKAWTWTAMDHSDPDSQPQLEFMAARFQYAETAAEFAKFFNQAKDLSDGKEMPIPTGTEGRPKATSTLTATPTVPTSGADPAPAEASAPQAVQSQAIDSTTEGMLVAKKEAGSWNCLTCYSPNLSTDLQCPCCFTPNPNAPKSDADAFKANVSDANASASQAGSKFCFGTSSGQKPSTTFSFGIPQSGSSNAPSSTNTTMPFLTRSPLAGVATPPVPPATPEQQKDSSATDNAKQLPATGLLKVDEKPGKWNCSDCYTENEPTDAVCPCCGKANPNAPAAPKAESTAMKPGLFSFGLNQKTSYSFGIQQTTPNSVSTQQQETKQGSNVLSPSIFSFGNTSGGAGTQLVPPAKPEQQNDPSVTNNAQQLPATGPLQVDKKPGKWNCSDCYAENEPTDVVCPCCSKANPNAPATPKAESTAMKPGLFSFGSNQNTSYSFGIKQTTPNSVSTQQHGTKPGSNVISPPKFSFGKASGGAFAFGLPSSGDTAVNTSNTSGQMPNLFSSDLSSNLSNTTTQPTSDSTRPRFPSVGGEEEENSDDEVDDSEYETTEDSSNEEEEDFPGREERYRSPLNRPQQEQKKNEDDDDDVVCLEGDKGTDDASESEKDQATKSDSPVSHPAVTTTTATSTTAQTSESSAFGFNAAAGSSFADLVQSNTTGGTFGSSTANSGGWVGLTEQKPLFANLSQHETSQDGEEHYKNDEADNIHFEPVIKLPDKVETVTGEEDEETLYTQRCKLYRFNKLTNEWKERGLGDIKFLKHHKTGKIRIVMRREQVLKVCANHYIRPGMTLDASKTSDRAWSWTAMDFTDEGEPKLEVFTARFKSVDIAKEFKKKFDMCQTMLLDAEPMTPCKASSMRSQELTEKAEKMKNEIKFFKDKFSQPSKVDLDNTITDEATLKQKPTPPVDPLTPLVAQHTESLQKSPVENVLQDSIFETPHKPKSLGSSDNKFSFHAKPSNVQENDNSSRQQREHTISACSDDPQAEKDIHFEPIVQLPEKVELVTGEEDEQVIFVNRAKLYAFHKETKQWKERGLGDVKILQNFSTFKVRVVMRREQVFKVCLNHLIKTEYNLTFKEPTAGKTLLWTAKDFSDVEKPDGEVLQFALRFKSTEIANSFKDVWESGADAAAAKTHLDPDPSDINTSMLNSGGATSPGQVVQSPTSPVKQPTSTFSFTNIPSPFDADKGSSQGPVKVMGFVFGKPHEAKSASSSSGTFDFDTSKLSFSFTGTSTPQAIVGAASSNTSVIPPQEQAGARTNAAKSLFPAETDTSVESNLSVSPSEILTPSDKSNGVVAVQPPDPQVVTTKSDEAEPPPSNYGTHSNEYKPSPLATTADVTKDRSAAFQLTGKLKLKPASTDLSAQNTAKDIPVSSATHDDDDVVFICELVPTDDQKKRAEKLLLPATFFLHENNPLPPGFDEKIEDDKEDKILKFIEDRESGKLKLNEKTTTTATTKTTTAESSGFGDTIKTNTTKLADSSSNKEGWVFGGATQSAATFSSVGAASFGSPSSGVQNVGFTKDPSFQFPGAGKVMFASQTTEGDDHHDPASFKCEAQFKPVLEELPPLIEVKTGEEGEEIVFKERCKLYRYDKDVKAWKEKGVGEIKILRNDEYKLYRVVMRRDQVLKVCTNHVINETTNPEPHLGSTKSCSYFVMDYSESKIPIPEKIAIRFKLDELCKTYMDKIAEIKHLQEPQS